MQVKSGDFYDFRDRKNLPICGRFIIIIGMKILVAGSGGREHAILWRLSQDAEKHELYAAPGNAGTVGIATNLPIAAENIDDLYAWAQLARPDLVVVGPEAPLCLGLTDAIERLGIPVFGPNKAAAQMEGSKQFAKEIMNAAGVKTALAEVHTKASEAIAALDRFSIPVVIKADGLAAGKGVIIARTRDEAVAAITDMLDSKQFGEAGASILLETFLDGEEASILALIDGENIAVLPAAQDHKRVFDNDEGLNTGGMGAYSPIPLVDEKTLPSYEETIFRPVINELKKRGITYKGVLYAGLMIGSQGVNILEFNCRFGDPETEVILPRIEGNFAKLLLDCATGSLDPKSLSISPKACATVVMAAPGYPGSYPKSLEITGLEDAAAMENAIVFHAGTALKDGRVVTAGGRVLTVSALGNDLRSAVDAAYAAVGKIHFEGAHFRKDIAHKAFRW